MDTPTSLFERPLLISGQDQKPLLEMEDAIDAALSLRGYIEHRSSGSRIPVDTSSVYKSQAYKNAFGTMNFDAMTLDTLYNVEGGSRRLLNADVTLKKIGGVAAAQISKRGDLDYSFRLNTSTSDLTNVKPQIIDFYDAVNIIEDLQAATSLGRPTHDEENRSFSVPVNALESLLSSQTLDRSSGLLYSDNSTGTIDTEVALAETLLSRDKRGHAKIGKEISILASRFDVITTQDLFGGEVITGLHFKSSKARNGKTDITAQLSAKINNSRYHNSANDDAELRALIQNTVDQYQDPSNDKFTRAMVKHIIQLSRPEFDVMRMS